MTNGMRGRLRRLVAATVAAVLVTVGLTAVTGTPAHADSNSAWFQLRNWQGGECLATDFSRAVYVHQGCGAPQRWRFQHLGAYKGESLVRNEATGLCLMQMDFYTVRSAGCDGIVPEQRWKQDGNHLQGTHIWFYLAKESRSANAYLSPGIVPRAYWDFVY